MAVVVRGIPLEFIECCKLGKEGKLCTSSGFSLASRQLAFR